MVRMRCFRMLGTAVCAWPGGSDKCHRRLRDGCCPVHDSRIRVSIVDPFENAGDFPLDQSDSFRVLSALLHQLDTGAFEWREAQGRSHNDPVSWNDPVCEDCDGSGGIHCTPDCLTAGTAYRKAIRDSGRLQRSNSRLPKRTSSRIGSQGQWRSIVKSEIRCRYPAHLRACQNRRRRFSLGKGYYREIQSLGLNPLQQLAAQLTSYVSSRLAGGTCAAFSSPATSSMPIDSVTPSLAELEGSPEKFDFSTGHASQ